LQQLFLVPSYALNSKDLYWQVAFLASFKWLKNYRLWLTPFLIVISYLPQQLALDGVCNAITTLTDQKRGFRPLPVKKSPLRRFIEIPAGITLALVRSLGWDASLSSSAKRIETPRSTPVAVLIENTVQSALGSLGSLAVTMMFYPIVAVTARAEALHFVSTTGPTWLKSDIYPLLPSLSNMTSMAGLHTAARYAGKILLCYAIKGAAIGIMIQVRAAFARNIIKKQRRLVWDNDRLG